MNKSKITKIAKTLNEAKKLPCILCKKPHPQFVAIFVPTESFAKKIGQPPGKQRIVFYSLCKKCSKKQNKINLVENELITEYQQDIKIMGDKTN